MTITRDVMDAIPTARNIGAIGILLPGTGIETGGGRFLAYDVGGTASCSSRHSPTLAGTRLDLTADLYNVSNSNGVVRLNSTYGPNWLRPTQTLERRFFKIGAQVDF